MKNLPWVCHVNGTTSQSSLRFQASLRFQIDLSSLWVSCNMLIDEILSINSSANVLVFGEFNTHHKDWLTYFGGTGRPGELIIFPQSSKNSKGSKCLFLFKGGWSQLIKKLPFNVTFKSFLSLASMEKSD